MNIRKMARVVAVTGLVSSLWVSTGCVQVRVAQPPPTVIMQGAPQNLGAAPNVGQVQSPAAATPATAVTTPPPGNQALDGKLTSNFAPGTQQVTQAAQDTDPVTTPQLSARSSFADLAGERMLIAVRPGRPRAHVIS